MLEGAWQDDELQGNGVMTSADGSRFEAFYVNGEACGPSREMDGMMMMMWY